MPDFSPAAATETYDVIVVGSGSAGAMAALTAATRGLSVLIVEKAHKYGGTSATSGGVLWVPNHGLVDNGDTREETMRYLDAVVDPRAGRERLDAFVDESPKMIAFMRAQGLNLIQAAWTDYFPEAPGARDDRSIISPTYDGTKLGKAFPLMREQYTRFKLFNRYAMDLSEMFAIIARGRGYQLTVAKIVARYWGDRAARKVGSRDRRFTSGAALMGQVYEKVFAAGAKLVLDTRLDELVVTDGKVSGVRVSSFGRRFTIAARHGVVIAAGGFEWNQALRDRFFTVPGLTRHSSTPEDANRGEALEAGLAIGGATEFTETGWWIPTMQMPMPNASNFEEIHQAAFDVGRPHAVCVNRNGDRFVDEACGYDRFGKAMMDDQLATGANTPCWLVFDAQFREKFTAGGFLPKVLMPDAKIPVDWWDHYIFKADSVDALAAKIHLDPAKLGQVVRAMNGYAKTGVDAEFGRGDNAYDRMFGDPSCKPNPCLGTIDKPPYYAVPINLGDLGTKGGLKCDARARVLDGADRPIPGLYAAGNATGSPFGDCYPGAGATIGPAMTFGFVAANDIAERTANQRA